MGKELLSRWPNNVPCHAALVINYAAMGRDDEARAAVQDLLRIDPKFSAQRYARLFAYKDSGLAAQVLELMHKAGLPD